MKIVFKTFLKEMVNDVPGYIYEMLLYLLCLFVVISFAKWGWRKGILSASRFALAEYIFLIYCSTVLYRPTLVEKSYNFTPFWSYLAYDRVERPELLPENIMNVVVFIPLGVLLGAGFRKMKWWMAMLLGFGISLSVEALQYFFKLGVSEFDDLMHNTLGCLIGYGIYKMVQASWLRIHGKKSVESGVDIL